MTVTLGHSSPPSSQHGAQGTFDEIGTPLREVTFVVFDLETTGASPEGSGITEVGAVKVRGGEVRGEFQSLVNPGKPIPAFIAVLTGITDAMVASAPRIGGVLAAFLEFARGAVLVAHNAPFDIGFLRAACVSTGHDWPRFAVVDTARLARRALTRDEAPDCKLSTLARILRASTTPNHRALTDARATVDVLHSLFERLGSLGVQTLEELTAFSARVSPEQRRKRHLAEALPVAPGVYQFLDVEGHPLYIGKAKNLRSRVRHYFTASEMRSRMAEMVGLTEQVTYIRCATELEAEVRELRLIAAHKPRYNRRSRFPERAVWVKVTVEPFPRLSIVRAVHDDATTYLGPFGNRRAADLAVNALHEAFPIRQCTARLTPGRVGAACILAEMGRCGAPCVGGETVDAYAEHVAGVRQAMLADPDAVVAAVTRRISRLSAMERFEEAASQRDRLAAFLRGAARLQRLAALTSCAQLVAARATPAGGWEITVTRHGRLAATGVAPPGAAPRPYVDALVATAETVRPGPGPTPAASAEETECVLRWLDLPGTRLVEVDGMWCSPVRGAVRHRRLAEVSEAQAVLLGGGQRRPLRPLHQPAR
jgi:DNA polymerase-3 subunit epsilon